MKCNENVKAFVTTHSPAYFQFKVLAGFFSGKIIKLLSTVSEMMFRLRKYSCQINYSMRLLDDDALFMVSGAVR